MFWNGKIGSGTCEYKRTVNQYCFPYDDSWCDYSAPMGQGLTCAKYSNPYGSEYGEKRFSFIFTFLHIILYFRCLSMWTNTVL